MLGRTIKTISVVVNGDSAVEQNETFFVDLNNQQAPASARRLHQQGAPCRYDYERRRLGLRLQ
jgi:hypothetical protein